MSSQIRKIITNQVINAVCPHLRNNELREVEKIIISNLKLSRKKKINNQFLLNLTPLKSHLRSSSISEEVVLRETRKQISDVIIDVKPEKQNLIAFEIETSEFTEKILKSYDQGCQPILENNMLFQDKQHKDVIIEYGSPNVAKPFHAGHLRSIIIGNVLANLKEYVGNKVTRINYLGDWGTQFGLLQVGFRKYGDENLLNESPISHLFDVYVRINKDLTENPEIIHQAKDIFKKMEEGDKDILTLWQRFRDTSISEFEAMYKRIGVVFDLYHGESMYRKNSIENVNDILTNRNLFVNIEKTGQKGIKIYQNGSENVVPLIKSDGTYLYIMRDIAAAIDRKHTQGFDEMHYVVENGQAQHFYALFNILKSMSYEWHCNLNHVKFGRIHGMSSRKGNVILLKDIFDDAKSRSRDAIENSETTKTSIDDWEELSDILGVGSVIINDLRSARLADYKFDWNRVVNIKGDSGISLQYCHARLCNLEKNCGITLSDSIDHTKLLEPEALQIIKQLARFDEVLFEANEKLEPCAIVQYLFHLSRVVNSGLTVLRIKNETDLSKAKARLKLFSIAKNILADGMKIAGLKPLREL